MANELTQLMPKILAKALLILREESRALRLLTEQIDNQSNNDGAEDNEKLLATVAATRKERDDYKKRLRDLESKVAGIDLDRYQALETEAKERSEKDLENSKNFESLKNIWNKEKQDFKSKLDELQNEIKSTNLKHKWERAFFEAGGLTEVDDEDGVTAFDLLYEQAQRYIKDDRIINPKDGLALTTKEGDDFSFKDLMGKLRSGKVTSALFSPPQNNGSGTSQGQYKGAKTISRTDVSSLSNQQGMLEKIASGEIIVN